jgi:preprotein translocase subunit SecY
LQLSPLIVLGQSELQKRILKNSQIVTQELHVEVKHLSDMTDKNTKSSELYSKASKEVAVVALILSAISIVISIYFSMQSSRGEDEWRHQQTSLLQGILNK